MDTFLFFARLFGLCRAGRISLLAARVFLAFCAFGCAVPPCPAAAPEPTQLVAITGALPSSGRVVIRSGMAWTAEDAPLFKEADRALTEELAAHGLTVIPVTPSKPAPLPPGAEAIRNVPVPKNKGGGPKRVMSVAEAVSRMRAMQLAREGRLPQARFGKGGDSGARKGAPSREGFEELPELPRQELIRFAFSQERGMPELRGRITVPGRMPEAVRESDTTIAEYAVLVRFSMIWPASGIPEGEAPENHARYLAIGWHLLELECYDLRPVKTGRPPREIWSATVQRVAFSRSLRWTLPLMINAAFGA